MKNNSTWPASSTQRNVHPRMWGKKGRCLGNNHQITSCQYLLLELQTLFSYQAPLFRDVSTTRGEEKFSLLSKQVQWEATTQPCDRRLSLSWSSDNRKACGEQRQQARVEVAAALHMVSPTSPLLSKSTDAQQSLHWYCNPHPRGTFRAQRIELPVLTGNILGTRAPGGCGQRNESPQRRLHPNPYMWVC